MVKTWRHKVDLGAEPIGSHRGHGRTDSIRSGFVAGRSDHPAFPRASNGHRFAAKCGVIPMLHGGVEGVHLDMDDFAKRMIRHRLRSLCVYGEPAESPFGFGFALPVESI